MISLHLAYALLALAPAPDDFVEPPMLEIGVVPPCSSDRDCYEPAPYCNTNTEQCVMCLGPEHCPEGWDCQEAGYCRDVCEADADCDGRMGQTVCDPETGFCEQCLSSSDCPPEQYCTSNLCLDDHCVPGTVFCMGRWIVECLEDGGATMHLETCDDECEDDDGTAACVTLPASTGEPGGSSDAGAGTSDPTSGGKPIPSSSSESGGDAGEAALDGRGCACRSTGASSGPGWAWLLVLGAALRRRRLSPASRRCA